MRCAFILCIAFLVLASYAYAGNVNITAAEGNGKDKYCIGPCFNTGELMFSDNPAARVYIMFDLSAVPEGADIKNAYLLFRYKGNTTGGTDFAKVYPVIGGWQEDDSQQPGYGQLVGSLNDIDCGRVCDNETGWFGTSGYGLIYILNQFLKGTNDGLVIKDATSNFTAYSSEAQSSNPFLYIEYEAGCEDLDNDGFGTGDCLGMPDCNDSDPSVNPNATEVCDNKDDDCNGIVDDTGHDCTTCEKAGGFACNQSEYCTEPLLDVLDSPACCPVECNQTCPEGDTRTCGTEKGECISGYSVCHKNIWSECIDETGPTQEVCNGKDDDCNGIVDDTPDPSSCGCYNGSAPKREIYDKIDNDCDGLIDENATCLSRGGSECKDEASCPGILINGTEVAVCCSLPCSSQCSEGESKTCGISVGACMTGVMNCTGGKWGECTGSVGPIAETCNMIDDDCNGIVDDVDDPSTCRCSGGGTPMDELCNGIDDDCNGQIDDGCTFISDACSDGVSDFGENGTDCGGSCSPCEKVQYNETSLASGIGSGQDSAPQSLSTGSGSSGDSSVGQVSSPTITRLLLYILIPIAVVIIAIILIIAISNHGGNPETKIGGGIDRGEVFSPGNLPQMESPLQPKVNRYEEYLKKSAESGKSADDIRKRINDKF